MAHAIKGTDAVRILNQEDVVNEFADVNNPIPIIVLSRLEFILNTDDIFAINKAYREKGDTAGGAMLRNRLMQRYTDQPNKFTLKQFIQVLIHFNTNIKLADLLHSKCVVSSGERGTEGRHSEAAKYDKATAGKPKSVKKSVNPQCTLWDGIDCLDTAEIDDFHFPPKSILLVGGRREIKSDSGQMEIYCIEDESKGRVLRTNLQVNRHRHIGGRTENTIVISSGSTYNGYWIRGVDHLKSTEFIHIPTGRWIGGPEMINSRIKAMGAVIDDTFFVFGGHSNATSEKIRITSTSAKWKSIKRMPHKIFDGGTAIAVDKQIYIVTRSDHWYFTTGGDMSSLVYVPAYDKYYETIPALKEVKAYFASNLLNNNTIVVTGGFRIGPLGGTNFASCHVYDIRNNTKKWEALSDMNSVRCNHQLVNIDDKLYAIGGNSGNDFGDKRLSSVEMFDIRCNKWMDVHPLKHQREDFVAIAI